MLGVRKPLIVAHVSMKITDCRPFFWFVGELYIFKFLYIFKYILNLSCRLGKALLWLSWFCGVCVVRFHRTSLDTLSNHLLCKILVGCGTSVSRAGSTIHMSTFLETNIFAMHWSPHTPGKT